MIIKTKQEIERRKQVLLMSADTLKFVFNDSINKYNEIIHDAEKRLYLLKQIVAEYKQ